jgi:hypothetical protein
MAQEGYFPYVREIFVLASLADARGLINNF